MPTVQLRPMTPQEFEHFKASSVRDYARELTASGQSAPETALADALRDFEEGLPQGLQTPDNFVLTAVNAAGHPVGVLWYETQDKRRAFIEDFLIAVEMRRQGYGLAVLGALRQRLRREGIPAMSCTFLKATPPQGHCTNASGLNISRLQTQNRAVCT